MIVRSVCSSGYGCGRELLYWCAHIQTASKQFIPLFSGLKRNKIRYLENISDRANSITRIISYSHMLTSMVLFLFTFGAHVFRWLAFSYIQFTFKIMCADCCVVQIDEKKCMRPLIHSRLTEWIFECNVKERDAFAFFKERARWIVSATLILEFCLLSFYLPKKSEDTIQNKNNLKNATVHMQRKYVLQI